jgi:hypothetical protein
VDNPHPPRDALLNDLRTVLTSLGATVQA